MLLSPHHIILLRSHALVVQRKLHKNGLPFLFSCKEDTFLLHTVPLGHLLIVGPAP